LRDVVRRAWSGERRHSLKTRPGHLTEALRSHGHGIGVLELQGALFFGTADALRLRLEALAGQADTAILDLHQVGEIDVTAARILCETAAEWERMGKRLVFAEWAPHDPRRTLVESLAREAGTGGLHFEEHTDRALEHAEEQLLQRLRAGGRIQRYETIRLTKAGHRIDIALSMSPLTGSAGQLLGAAEVARDVTERNQATKALSGLSRRLIHAQEEERSRIARDLHDDIGQRVALLSVELSDLSAGSGLAAPAARLQALASEIASDIQALSHRLHSSKLELLGVSAAMQSFCGEFGEQQGVTVDFESRDVSRHLPSEISLCLFRILQEALHNAAKHSGASHFSAQLSGSGREIQLVVSDAGTGFDLDAVRGGRGLGLVSMEERLKLVDGSLAVDTKPGRGTRIRASVPLPSES